MLDALDLDPLGQAAYESLVDGPPRTAAELAEDLGRDERATTAAVAALERHGLVSRVPGTPVRYAAIAPDIALEVLFLERERRLKQARAYAQQLSARFQRSGSRGDPAELVEVITGVPAIRQRWEQLQRGLKHELRGIDKPPYTVDRRTSEDVESELLPAGIGYRIIYDTAGLESFHDWHTDIEASIRLGEEARVLTDAPTKLVIFDDRRAMLPLQPDPSSIVSMIVVHPSGLLEALCALFEDLWRRALPLDTPRPPTGDGPTEDELRLLKLLATGMPDSSIAKHLGLSHRTLQRRLRLLLDRLGAGTRFQAGLRAARRGWLG